MALSTQLISDLSVFLNTSEFGETGTLVPVSGSTKTITFVRQTLTDQIYIEPGYADTDQFSIAQSAYSQPIPGDHITDSNNVVWIVEPGARFQAGLWLVPVKSDLRIRA